MKESFFSRFFNSYVEFLKALWKVMKPMLIFIACGWGVALIVLIIKLIFR